MVERKIGNLNVAEGGSGARLVMLHGVVRRWQTWLPLFPALRERHRVQAVDMRGHGKSEREARYRVVDYVEDAVALVAAEPGPVRLYGHSLGAMVAAGVAARMPERVEGVVLEDPPFETMGARLGSSGLGAFFEAMVPYAGSGASVGEVARGFGGERVRRSDGTEAEVRMLRDGVSLRFTAAALRQLDCGVLEGIVDGGWLEGYDWEAVLKGVGCPALLLQADGAQGGMLTDEDVGRAKEWMADTTVVKLGCGHVMHWAQTGTVGQMAASFFETL